MDNAEYWLLDLVVDRWFALEWLLADDLEQRASRQGHGLSYNELVGLLQYLFQRKELVAQRMLPAAQRVVGDDFQPDHEQIQAALAGKLHLAYWLTTRGGKRWEKYARPDWHRYVAADCRSDERQGLAIIGYDRARVQAHLARLSEQWRGSLTAGTETWDTLVPWEATYWKVLPMAHRVSVRPDWRHIPADLRDKRHPSRLKSWLQSTFDTFDTWCKRRPC
jgi:hypothetical protein